jgi:purine-nucleoside phosphorylase
MESSALYANAARFGRSALSILTISDNMVTGADTDAHVRQTAFTKMMDVAFSLV